MLRRPLWTHESCKWFAMIHDRRLLHRSLSLWVVYHWLSLRHAHEPSYWLFLETPSNLLRLPTSMLCMNHWFYGWMLHLSKAASASDSRRWLSHEPTNWFSLSTWCRSLINMRANNIYGVIVLKVARRLEWTRKARSIIKIIIFITTRFFILLLFKFYALFLEIVHDPLLKQLLFSLNPCFLDFFFSCLLINLLLKL